MPEYVYRCQREHKTIIVHPVASITIYCDCGATMHRVPQAVRINWNGLRPCDGGISPVVQQMIKYAPQKRAEFAERKERHVKKTEAERKHLAASDPTYGKIHHKIKRG